MRQSKDHLTIFLASIAACQIPAEPPKHRDLTPSTGPHTDTRRILQQLQYDVSRDSPAEKSNY